MKRVRIVQALGVFVVYHVIKFTIVILMAWWVLR